MRVRSAYHIDYTAPDLGGFEVKIWVGNLFGVPTYEQTVRAINGRVTVDIAELVKSLIPKDGISQPRVRYKVDAFTNATPAVFFKTWQKEYVARFGYNKFEEGAQVDSEILVLDQFDQFDFLSGSIDNSNEDNPWLEDTATKVTTANNIQFRAFVPQGKINFSNFYYFDEGTYTITVQFGLDSFIVFDLIVSSITGNQIQVDDVLNADVKIERAGTSIGLQGELYSFIEVEGESTGTLTVTIDGTNESIMYSPSVQRYFDNQGIDQVLQQTNQKFFWKKGEPLNFAYLLNSTQRISTTIPINYNLKDGTTESLAEFGLFAEQPSNKEVETVEFNIIGGDNVLIPVEYIPCTKQPITQIEFINKLGIRQTLWFYGSFRVSNQNENESYKSNILVNGGYNVAEHQFKNYNAQAKQRVVINTGYYSEDFNDVFEELFLSERIWINKRPAQIESKQFEQRTRLNDDLINYEITFEYANDYISNVR